MEHQSSEQERLAALRHSVVQVAVAGQGNVDQSFKAWITSGVSPAALHAVRRREERQWWQ
jgi:hypothetical protein